MEEELISTFTKSMQARSTEELLSIWYKHNTDEWTADAFEAIRRVLVSRGETPTRHEPRPTMDKGWVSPWTVPHDMTAIAVVTPFKRDFHMPQICTGCGAPSSGLTRTVHQHKQYGKATFTLGVSFPVCRECQEAAKQVATMGDKAALRAVSLGLVVLAGMFMFLMLRAETDWGSSLGLGLMITSPVCLIAMAIINRIYTGRLPGEIRVRSRNLDHAVGIANFRPVVVPQQYSQGDVGAIEFVFTNRSFAEQFARSNGGKLA
jgi:hypothetical protein